MASLSMAAQTQFRTQELQRLAKVISLDAQALPEGWSHPMASGIRLTVHMENKTIDHIGISLFSDEIRSMEKKPIFDFLERYFLQLKYPPQLKTLPNMIRDDQFHFITGSLEIVDKVMPTEGFAYSCDNHRYVATWKRDGNTLLSVSFPVEYELISGENKIESEDNLQNDIRRTVITSEASGTKKAIASSYISDDFTNRLYYVDNKLVEDQKHPVETVANMMLSQQTSGDYSIRMTQVSYGFKNTMFEVPLRQWIAYCQNHDCELYFGVEQITPEGDVDGVVMAVNTAENYNHVLTVHVPQSVLETKTGTVEARLYSYVPTHNVLNLFAAYRKSNSKTYVSR